MGGKLLNGRRINKDEYDIIVTNIHNILRNFICTSVSHVADKTTFGDIDFVIVHDSPIEFTKKTLLGVPEFSSFVNTSNNSISFLYEGVQCDATICETAREYSYTRSYMAYGDAGMFFGRLSRVYDLKFGIDGLEYVYRENGKEATRIFLSKEFKYILSFLGYKMFEKNPYADAFSPTYEQLKEFLFSSIRIDRRFLLADSENTKHRKRDRTRPFFAELYAHMQDNRDKFPEKTRFDIPSGPAGIDYIESWFPSSNLLDEITTFKNNRDMMMRAAKHFGGKHILENFPMVTEKNIGNIISKWEYSILPTELGRGSMDYRIALAEYKLSKTKKELLDEVSGIIENLDQDT